MEDQIYETMDDYTLLQINKFVAWCNRVIGTETEVSEADNNVYYCIVADLTVTEVDKIRNYEHTFRLDEGM